MYILRSRGRIIMEQNKTAKDLNKTLSKMPRKKLIEKAVIRNIKDPQALITRKEVAILLDCKESTLAAWKSCNRYNLPCIKIGKNVRYRLGDVMAFIEKNISNSNIPDTK